MWSLDAQREEHGRYVLRRLGRGERHGKDVRSASVLDYGKNILELLSHLNKNKGIGKVWVRKEVIAKVQATGGRDRQAGRGGAHLRRRRRTCTSRSACRRGERHRRHDDPRRRPHQAAFASESCASGRIGPEAAQGRDRRPDAQLRGAAFESASRPSSRGRRSSRWIRPSRARCTVTGGAASSRRSRLISGATRREAGRALLHEPTDRRPPRTGRR